MEQAMKEIEVNLEDVDPEIVDGIVSAIAEAIDGVAYLDPTMDELVVAVGEVFQALVESEDGQTMH